MITTSRFLGYDKNEYGDLIVNRKEAEIEDYDTIEHISEQEMIEEC